MAINQVNCPYCASFVTDLYGMLDLWQEINCRYCNNTFSVRIQVSKEPLFVLNEVAVKEKDEMVARARIKEEDI